MGQHQQAWVFFSVLLFVLGAMSTSSAARDTTTFKDLKNHGGTAVSGKGQGVAGLFPGIPGLPIPPFRIGGGVSGGGGKVFPDIQFGGDFCPGCPGNEDGKLGFFFNIYGQPCYCLPVPGCPQGQCDHIGPKNHQAGSRPSWWNFPGDNFGGDFCPGCPGNVGGIGKGFFFNNFGQPLYCLTVPGCPRGQCDAHFGSVNQVASKPSRAGANGVKRPSASPSMANGVKRPAASPSNMANGVKRPSASPPMANGVKRPSASPSMANGVKRPAASPSNMANGVKRPSASPSAMEPVSG